MIWWQLTLAGAFGGLAVEVSEFYGAIRRTGGWPWRQKGEPPPGPLLVSVVIRVLLGAGLAWVLGDAQQISGTAGGFAVGVAAPLILEQMQKHLPAKLELGTETKEALPEAKPPERPKKPEAPSRKGKTGKSVAAEGRRRGQ